MSPQRRRTVIRLVCTVVVAGLVGGCWYVSRVLAALDGTLGVPCDEAARFAKAAPLPPKAHDRRCTAGQWQSISYELDFRAPREEVEDWLQASYPGTELSGDCRQADACSLPGRIRTAPADDGEPRRADALSLELYHEPGGTTRVRLSGWTI
ncbi:MULTISPECIES: hypothetical protein [Streptomyces]|uniref:hypothetical protein n=1 Tax=Streptomyces TaxID=1883 RepID=UPI00167A753B|nr:MULTISPECIES: hypothetical protein [Streptomyces]MBD3577580.1 hypothetical protein [Streptomyces sp. KD18]GGT09803.1 hypothetical protein GCM10010286_39130 [Streptomyces toxytricini]